MALRHPAAVAALLVNATTWGLAWWPIRRLSDAGLHTLWATALIYSVATVAILFTLRGRIVASFRGEPVLWLLVVASGVTNGSFNWAVTIADVARVALLFYLMPIWAALLARWLLAERLTFAVAGRIVVALVGAGFVLLDPQRPSAPSSWFADGLAVVAGIGFAFNTVTLRRVAGLDRGAISLAMFGGGALLPGAVALVLTIGGYPPPVPASPGGWMLIVVVVAIAFLVGNLALQFGAARLPANTTSLIMLAEIGVAAVSAAWIAGEALSTRVLLGGALIVGAVATSLLPCAPSAPDRATPRI